MYKKPPISEEFHFKRLFTPLPYDCLAMFLPFFFTNPQLVERAQAGQNAAAKPSTISSFDRIPGSMDFSVRERSCELTVQPIGKSRELAPATGKDDVAHQDLAKFGVTSAKRFRDQSWYIFREI